MLGKRSHPTVTDHARAVFILSCSVIAPLSRPSARWNGFLPSAFFFAGTHFRRAKQRTACDQTVELRATIQVLEHGRSCCQLLHIASGQTPWNDKLGDNRMLQGEERQARRWMAGTRSRRKAMILKHEPHHQRRRQRCGRHHPYHDYWYPFREPSA